MKLSHKNTLGTFLGITFGLLSIMDPMIARADVRLKKWMKVNGSREYFIEHVGGALRASQYGKGVAVLSGLATRSGIDPSMGQLRFIDAPGKPNFLLKNGELTLANGSVLKVSRVDDFRMSPDGSTMAAMVVPETPGQCTTCVFLINTTSAIGTELTSSQFFPGGTVPTNVTVFAIVSFYFSPAGQSLYVASQHGEKGSYPNFTPTSYRTLSKYDLASGNSQAVSQQSPADTTMSIDHITTNEAFALVNRGDFITSRINLATGESTDLVTKNDEYVKGLWLSNDGETAIFHLDYLSALREGRTTRRFRLLRLKSGKETFLSCTDRKRRYSTEFRDATVSGDGKFVTFTSWDNIGLGEQGPNILEVGVLNLTSGACAYLGETERYVYNSDGAITDDGSTLFFLQGQRKPGADTTIATTVYSATVKDIFKKGNRVK